MPVKILKAMLTVYGHSSLCHRRSRRHSLELLSKCSPRQVKRYSNLSSTLEAVQLRTFSMVRQRCVDDFLNDPWNLFVMHQKESLSHLRVSVAECPVYTENRTGDVFKRACATPFNDESMLDRTSAI